MIDIKEDKGYQLSISFNTIQCHTFYLLNAIEAEALKNPRSNE